MQFAQDAKCKNRPSHFKSSVTEPLSVTYTVKNLNLKRQKMGDLTFTALLVLNPPVVFSLEENRDS